MAFILTTAGAFATPTPTAAATLTAPGFAPDTMTLFAPILQVAPPGPARAARAIAILDRQLAFQRKISFHPEISPALQEVVDRLPLRQSTLIRAAALYGASDVPWTSLPDGTHEFCVTGQPRDPSYRYTLAKQSGSPAHAQHFAGVFALKPANQSADGGVSSVIATLGGEILIDTYGLGAIVDTIAAILPLVHGDLKPPWDAAPGAFNHHDRAALNRLHRQMPHFAAVLDTYLKYDNVLDEFDSPAGPIVLFDLDAEVRQDALRKYPHLHEFFGKLAGVLTAGSEIVAGNGKSWWRTGFERGHIRLTFMDRGGLLTPFDSRYRPAGASVALGEITRGGYRTIASVRVTSLGMDFGLGNLDFTTTYWRGAQEVKLETRMTAVPELIAPPGIHKMMDLVAGDFLRVMAQGNGGMVSQLASRPLPAGLYDFAGGFTAELAYSPTLELLARIGDALAQEHNDAVRGEERALGEELFDALVADYNDARPAILALDTPVPDGAHPKTK